MMYSGTRGCSRTERGERAGIPSSEIVSVSCDFICTTACRRCLTTRGEVARPQHERDHDRRVRRDESREVEQRPGTKNQPGQLLQAMI